MGRMLPLTVRDGVGYRADHGHIAVALSRTGQWVWFAEERVRGPGVQPRDIRRPEHGGNLDPSPGATHGSGRVDELHDGARELRRTSVLVLQRDAGGDVNTVAHHACRLNLVDRAE